MKPDINLPPRPKPTIHPVGLTLKQEFEALYAEALTSSEELQKCVRERTVRHSLDWNEHHWSDFAQKCEQA